MQEFLSVPIVLLHKSVRLSLDQLALVETLGIGAHAVDRSGLRNGEKSLVVGAGPLSIAVSQFASALGAMVHIVEKSAWRRDFVKHMGYTSSEAAGDQQADVVFDATGSAAISASIRVCDYAGRYRGEEFLLILNDISANAVELEVGESPCTGL
jgi:threonine dehydrogenase-like Zn-dependent dehydrogenase